jgi:hypothetical protein
MKAVLVGKMGTNKLYYILDAKYGENDAIVEDASGEIHETDFMSLVSSTTGIRKMMNSPFHRLLWDGPHEKLVKSWKNIFINKTQEPDENMLNGAVVQTSVGNARKKAVATEMKVKQFARSARLNKASSSDFSSKMIISRKIQ